MNISIENVTNYIDFLSVKQGLKITLHGEIACFHALVKYNFHSVPYCQYVKNTCRCVEYCIEKQDKVKEKCRGGEFYGICYAGVGEFVYPICDKTDVVGFISISGYKNKDDSIARQKLSHFVEKYGVDRSEATKMWEKSLNDEIPDKNVLDTVIMPLKFMLEAIWREQIKPNESSDKTLYSEILRFVTENYMCKLNAKDIAERFNYSVSTVSHVFRKNNGKSISEYIEALRLERAEWLITNTDMSVTDIAYLLGFCNSNYFSNVFKRKNGISPKDYRKNLIK